MKCIITLEVAGESILVLVDSSRLPKSLKELKDILGLERWKTLVDKVNTTLKDRKKINKPDLEEMSKSSHIIPNTTIGALMNRFSDISFPEDSDLYNVSNLKVLFVDSYKTKTGELKYGLFTNPDGELIFIVDRYNIDSIAKYLLTMKSLKSDHVLKNVSPIIMDELKLLLEESKKHIPGLSSIEDMLVSFLQNRSKYRDIMFSMNEKFMEKYENESRYNLDDSINAYAYLDELTGNLFEISHRKSYNNPTINNIQHSLTWNKSFTTASIGIDKLFLFLPMELKSRIADTVGEETLSLEKFKELFSGKINQEQLNNIFGKSGEDPFKLLMDYLIQQEPEFALEFKEVKKDRIYLSKYFQSLERLYGIGFEQLLKYNEPIYYNGKYIQLVTDDDGVSVYYVTRHYTTPDQRAKKFSTLEEAYNYINKSDEPIVKNSFIELHKKEQASDGTLISDDRASLYFRTRKKYKKGLILTLLDYDVPNVSLNLLTPEELLFVSENYMTFDEKHKYATKEDFYEYVKTGLGFPEYSEGYYTIVNNINTPEKIALFIMRLNNPNTGKKGKAFNKNSEKAILKLARDIGKVDKYRYYYVESSGDLYVRLLRIDNESKEAYRKEPYKPAIQLWNAASKALSPKLGIDILILTEPEVGKENAKAYIKGGKVYINAQKANSSDLFHEYVHILMAYLKNTPLYRSRYVELINMVWEAGKDDLFRKEIEENEFYKNYSIEDKMEEYFVDLFGRWIKNNAKEDFRNIFSSSDVLKEGSSIFSSTTPISELYGSTVSQVFLKLNSDVALFFKDNLPLMSSEYKNLFKVSRQKSEWIRQQIKEGKLREYDCV